MTIPPGAPTGSVAGPGLVVSLTGGAGAGKTTLAGPGLVVSVTGGAGAGKTTLAGPGLVVSVTGGAGAGKTTLAKALVAAFGDVTVVHLDDHYHVADSGRGVWVPDEDGIPRLDVGDPRSIDVGGAESAVNEALVTSPVVVVEGLFAIDVRPAMPCERFDVFLDLAADLRLARKIYRKCVRGDFPVEILLANYVNHRRDAHDRHVQPARDRCDLVVDGRLPADQLAAQIRHALGKRPRLT